jgi:hypothetical protein
MLASAPLLFSGSSLAVAKQRGVADEYRLQVPCLLFRHCRENPAIGRSRSSSRKTTRMPLLIRGLQDDAGMVVKDFYGTLSSTNLYYLLLFGSVKIKQKSKVVPLTTVVCPPMLL